MPNLLIRSLKLGLNNPLVRISTIFCVVGKNDIQIAPLSIFSSMKCLSISTCFVRSCYIEFCAMLMAVLLSQYNFIGMLTGIFKSSSTLFNHYISQTPWVIAWYSTSALLLATTFCFFALPRVQVTPNICAISWCRSLISNWTYLVCISVGLNVLLCILQEVLTFAWCTFKYLRVWYTASRCFLLGKCMNWLTMLTTNAISSCVCDK